MGTNKVITTTRKAYCQKGTLYVAIPKKFAERHNIQPGDELIILADDTMRVIPRERWNGYGRPPGNAGTATADPRSPGAT